MRRSNKEDIVIIGQNIRKLREECGVTQRDLAALLGVSFQQINKYEKGVNRLPIEKMYLFSKTHNIALEHFFNGIKLNNIAERPYQEFEPHMFYARLFEAMPEKRMQRKLIEIAQIVNTA